MNIHWSIQLAVMLFKFDRFHENYSRDKEDFWFSEWRPDKIVLQWFKVVFNPLKMVHVLERLQQPEYLNTCEGSSQWKLEEGMKILQTSVSEILMEDLGRKCVMAKFFLHLLSWEQKQFCAEVVQCCFIQLTVTHIPTGRSKLTED